MFQIRLDRILTLSPFGRLSGLGRTPGIPILMYHGVRNEIGARHPYYETNISPAVFEYHLQFLRQQGYVSVGLSDVLGRMKAGQHDKVVAITFDDGYHDFHSQAFPLLRKYGFNATLYVPSAWVGKKKIGVSPEQFMTWREIREVSQYGVEIGSHTATHPDLYRVDPQTLEDEIKLSKHAIEDNIGQPVRSFAYPFAFPEQDRDFACRIAGLLEEVDYQNGVCTVVGRAGKGHNRFLLPRLPVNSHDDAALLDAKLKGRYDWLHLPQYAHKAVKALLHDHRRTSFSKDYTRTQWTSQSSS
jgi:peptidoglycan/xylan/chitin deacetylase (PgdA/CDA1 family)